MNDAGIRYKYKRNAFSGRGAHFTTHELGWAFMYVATMGLRGDLWQKKPSGTVFIGVDLIKEKYDLGTKKDALPVDRENSEDFRLALEDIRYARKHLPYRSFPGPVLIKEI